MRPQLFANIWISAVEGYLLDTSALTPLVDESHLQHVAASTTIAALGAAPIYVSTIALAEMVYGLRLYEKANQVTLPNADKMIAAAQTRPRWDVTHHTASAYAQLKADLASYYLPNVTREFRKKYVEDWINKFTCKALGVDDNDLWICAQARELNFVVVRGDKKMGVIGKADPLLKLLLIGEALSV
jgi:predicted nucleic acid-binding protein